MLRPVNMGTVAIVATFVLGTTYFHLDTIFVAAQTTGQEDSVKPCGGHHLHGNDGAVCGPYRVHRFAGEYRARTGYLSNTGHGVWACISHSSGGACGAAKWE